MLEFKNKGDIENAMSKWLEHPNEFGVSPKSVCHKRTYLCDIVGGGMTVVHLLEYEMPDGTKSRGFVNPPLTWSFVGDVSDISDDDLLLAYCGWSWLFPRIQIGGSVLINFTSEGEEACYIAQKQAQGINSLEITARYKIGASEVFEFRGILAGKPIRGAGNTESETIFAASNVCFKLPPIYFFLGSQVLISKQ